MEGDVLVAVSEGSYKVYDNNGGFKETISTISDGLGGFTAGCAFNPALDKLYTTNFSNTMVVVYADPIPHTIVQTINTGTTSPEGLSESIVFDAAGNFYVGHPAGNQLLHKYDAAGHLLTTFMPETENRGTDWNDLATDQRTMFYTSEGGRIMRFDVVNNEQLELDFANIGGISYALRLLPPGDGSGGLLVANTGDIKRLDGAGQVVQTYDVTDATDENCWFSLNLDPNGTSFWSGNFGSSKFYRFNIATGIIEVGPINTGTGLDTLFGLCVKGELTAALPPPPKQCPLTQGFWKNHPEAWPVTSLTLGRQSYTQAQLLTILRTPVRGDASLNLAHQLIAVKLNIADGSDPTPINATITSADSLLSGFAGPLPYQVKPSSAIIGQAMVNDAGVLDSYNNQQLTPGCTP